MQPFPLHCTTCRSRLIVNKAELLGQIITCPNCNSMVQIPTEPVESESTESPLAVPPLSAEPEGDGDISDTVDDFGYISDEASPVTDPVTDLSGDDQPSSAGEDGEAANADSPLPLDWNSQQSQKKRRLLMVVGATLGGVVLIAAVTGFWMFAGNKDVTSTAHNAAAVNQSSGATEGMPPTPDIIPETPDQPDTDPATPDPAETVNPTETAIPDSAAKPETVPNDNRPTTPHPDAVKPTNPPAPDKPAIPVAPPGFIPKRADPNNPNNLGSILGDLAPFLGNSPNPVLTGPERPHVVQPAPAAKPAAEVNIEAGLSFTIPNLVIEDEIPLIQFIYLTTTLGNFPLTIDLESLELTGNSLFSPVTVSTQNKSIEELLTSVLQPFGLTIIPDGGHVTVIHQRHLKPDVMRTTIALEEIALKKTSAGELAELINQLLASVDKPIAQVAKGDLASDLTAVTIEGNQRRQDQVRKLIGRMIQAEEKNRIDGLANELDAWQPYQQTSSLNFPRKTPFVRVLAYLNNETGLHFQVNWRELWKVGWTPGSQVTLVTDKEPLIDGLENLLAVHGLSFIARADNILEITSAEHALKTSLISFYDLSGLDAARRQILLKTLTALQQSAADEAVDDLTVHIRIIEQGPGGHLIVAAPAPIQRQITRILSPPQQ